ncbi:MAG: MarC family protein [Ignavibacteriaceae bacterium]
MNDVTGFFSSVLVTLVTLLPIINPISTAIILLSISGHLSKKDLNRQIILACLYMTGILVVFLLAGHFIMIFFGISIPGIRIAGGMVIGFLGFRMLFPDDASITQEGKKEAAQKENISFTPLARILGVNGVDSISRIMGFFLICIGIQFAIIGVQDLISDSGYWQKL